MIPLKELIIMLIITLFFTNSAYKFFIKKDKGSGIYYILIATFMLIALRG